MPLVLLSCLFAACTTERSLQVNNPAEVAIPASATRIMLVDRTKPRSGLSNAIEGAFSREGFRNETEIGAEMNRVLEKSLGTLRIYEVAVDPARYEGSGTGKLPDPLTWEMVETLAAPNDADVWWLWRRWMPMSA